MKNILKRAIIGITGLLLTSALTLFILIRLIDPDLKLLGYLILTVAVAIITGFVGYIIGGKSKFLELAPFGFFVTAFIIGANEVPIEYKTQFILAVIIIIIIACVYLKSRKGKKQVDQNVENDSADIAEILCATDESNERRSLLLLSRWNGYFQIIKGSNRYYFNSIGSATGGIKQEQVVKDFADESGFPGMSRTDFSVAKENIYMMRYSPKSGKESKSVNNGSITLFTSKGEKLYFIVDKISEEEVRKFFQGVPDYNQNKQDNSSGIKDSKVLEQSKINGIIKLNNILALVAILVAALFYLKIQYTVFSILCIVLSLASFVLYLKYNDILSISDSNKRHSGKVNIFLTMFLPSVAMLVRSFIDINIIGYKALILWSMFVFAIMILAFFVFSKEYRRAKSVIGMILIFVVTFSLSAAIQVNYIFDNRQSQNMQSQIIDMQFEGDEASPSTYYLTVKISNGSETKIKVDATVYNTAEVGGKAVVSEYAGFLGIRYVEINSVG